MGLADAGFDVTVIADACGSPPPHHHDGIERLRDAGIRITSVKGVFYEWMRDLSTYRDRVGDLVDEAPIRSDSLRSLMPSYRNSDTPIPIMQGSPPRLIPPRIDWDRAPWNRWSFQHVREMVPTAEVWRGRGPVRPLPRDDRDLDSSASRVERRSARQRSRAFLDETYTDGFIVLKSGRIVYERYFNNMDDRTLHLSQSVGKSITAATAGALIGRGLLDTESTDHRLSAGA